MIIEDKQTPPTGSQPGDQNSEGGAAGETVTMSKAELDALIEGKLKGSGKALKKALDELNQHKTAAELAAAKVEEERRAKLSEDGKKDELLQLLNGEKESLAKQHTEALEKIKAFEEREQARRAALAVNNAERIKGLPAEMQSIVPDKLSEDDISDYLSKLEKLIVTKKVSVFGGGGARMNGAPANPFERAKQVGHDFLFSANKKGNQ